MHMNINLDYYKIFYYVAKQGGISLAAKHLSLSQPAISQSIKQLETSLGTQLFVRAPKGVVLTQEGELLFTYIKKGYETILLGEQKLQERINLESGEIRIGASDMTLQFYLLPYLEQFHEQYPKIKVTVTNGPTPETLEYLEDGRIDFGVTTSAIQTNKNIIETPVKEIEDIFVAGTNFTYLKDKLLSYKQLETLPLISLEPNTSSAKYVNHILAKKHVTLTPEFELSTSEMIVQFAIKNLGIGCVMSEFAETQIEKGMLFQLTFTERIPKRHICVVQSRQGVVSNAARTLLNMIV